MKVKAKVSRGRGQLIAGALPVGRVRPWRISPDGFRELRLSCLLSQKSTAVLLGVGVATVRRWDRGERRVPWAVVRLLRLVRNGDLGAMDDEWRGFRLWRGVLYTADGHAFTPHDLERWWWDSQRLRRHDEAHDQVVIAGLQWRSKLMSLPSCLRSQARRSSRM